MEFKWSPIELKKETTKRKIIDTKRLFYFPPVLVRCLAGARSRTMEPRAFSKILKSIIWLSAWLAAVASDHGKTFRKHVFCDADRYQSIKNPKHFKSCSKAIRLFPRKRYDLGECQIHRSETLQTHWNALSQISRFTHFLEFRGGCSSGSIIS